MRDNKGAILTITIIFIIILAIISGVSIILMTNHAQITEYQLKRTRAYYTAQAGIIYAMEQIKNKSNISGPWATSLNGYTVNITLENKKLRAKVAY